jgi:hypothetical protein
VLGPLVLSAQRPPRAIELPASICVVSTTEVLVGVECSEPDPWFGNTRERAAAGAAICWWQADADRFSEIRGVGPAFALRIVDYRDRGRPLRIQEIEEVRGVGESMAARIVAATTDRCPHVGRTANAVP